jgi:hypothetical protein
MLNTALLVRLPPSGHFQENTGIIGIKVNTNAFAVIPPSFNLRPSLTLDVAGLAIASLRKLLGSKRFEIPVME